MLNCSPCLAQRVPNSQYDVSENLSSFTSDWEANGDYSRAIDAYMKMTVLQTTDYGLLVLEEVGFTNRK